MPCARSTRHRIAGPLGAVLAACALVAGPSMASARTISFSGHEWTVKASTSRVGPGPNVFSAASSNVWVDRQGRLHLKITRTKGRWVSAEVIGSRALGHGTYSWTLDSRVDDLDPNAVLGLFTWSDTPGFWNREIDIEFSRWGDADAPTNGQYVVPPYDTAGHLVPFAQPPVTTSQHSFTWAPQSVAFASSSALPAAWTYTGADVPPAGDARPRMNLWLYRGAAPTDGRSVEVVVRSFRFTPLP